MAIIYSKTEQGRTITVCNSLPVHTGSLGDVSTDSSTGLTYNWIDGAWVSTSLIKAVTTTSQLAPLSPDFKANDMYIFTVQSGGLIINNPASDPATPKGFMFRVKDDTTARSITWDTKFRGIGETLPTTTVSGKTTYVSGITNPTDGTYDVLSVKTEA